MIEVLEAETPKVKQFLEINHDRSFEANTSRESFASQSDESAVFVNWPLKGRIMSKLDKMNDYDDDDTFVEIGSGDFVLLRSSYHYHALAMVMSPFICIWIWRFAAAVFGDDNILDCNHKLHTDRSVIINLHHKMVKLLVLAEFLRPEYKIQNIEYKILNIVQWTNWLL